jgi:phosphate transport system permease protein
MKRDFTEKSRRRDRVAEWVIRVGGVLVIVAVVWILVMIARVAMPLFYPPSADLKASFPLPAAVSGKVLALGADENQQVAFVLDESGTFHFLKTADGSVTDSVRAPQLPGGATRLASAELIGKSAYALVWDNGAISTAKVTLNSSRAADGGISTSHDVASVDGADFPATKGALQSFARLIEGKGAMRVDRLANDRFRVTHQVVEKDFLGNEKRSNATAEIGDRPNGAITAVVLDQKGHYLYAGTALGWLMRWDVSEPGQVRLLDNVQAAPDSRAITSLGLVIGDSSLAVGTATGQLSVWFPVAEAGVGEDKHLFRIHNLKANQGEVSGIVASPRGRMLVSAAGDSIHVDYVTSARNLLSIRTTAPLLQTALSPQGNTLCAFDTGRKLTLWRLDIPHPETSFATLFGKVWYEGYDKPEFVWQSSAANDDFEPKMSLVPLIFGTLKATLFAMLFAVPLALLGALYTSQFMGPRVKAFLKPAVEIMAAVPSVVIGFLAGLWLAPLIDKVVLAFFMSIVLVPAMLLVLIFFWRLIKQSSPLSRLLRGNEFLVLVPVVLAGIYVSYLLGGAVEARFFAGDFKQWLYSFMGVRYDQRNAIIIAIALGFAVIPIIFTIAEDALSNVPRNLSAASLALGASRWQTAWRVVLPSALPGVFSAVMIGFGRAVGETMIVLMATGNTPIMSWSIFNGLRSLSANIAVEIPEAPLNGSLYRTLFLSAVLLFVLTFIINTVAEALRERFRRKYGRY